MNPTLTASRLAALPLGFATAVVLSSVLLSTAASLAMTARPAPASPAPALLPVLALPAPAGDTGVPDAARALNGAPEPTAAPVPTF